MWSAISGLRGSCCLLLQHLRCLVLSAPSQQVYLGTVTLSQYHYTHISIAVCLGTLTVTLTLYRHRHCSFFGSSDDGSVTLYHHQYCSLTVNWYCHSYTVPSLLIQFPWEHLHCQLHGSLISIAGGLGTVTLSQLHGTLISIAVWEQWHCHSYTVPSSVLQFVWEQWHWTVCPCQ